MKKFKTLDANDQWAIISMFFKENGLVRQQLDSFNQFINKKIQEIIDENSTLILKSTPTAGVSTSKEMIIKFGQIYVSQPPIYTETDGRSNQITPNEARIRDITYACQLKIDITKTVITENGVDDTQYFKKVPFGEIPIMVRSQCCMLNGLSKKEIVDSGECIYDEGGYFIVTGGEKVIIAQERIASNILHIFKKAQPAPYTYYSEIRSISDKSSRPPSPFSLKILKTPNVLRASLPYLKQDIPVMIIFKAMGFINDKDILDFIDKNNAYEEVLVESIKEASVIVDQISALDFIGKRSAPVGSTKDKRIEFANRILSKEFFPHMGTTQFCERKKAMFLGYMITKTLEVGLGLSDLADRDHYGKKRIDMAGTLLTSLFKTLFKKLCDETVKHMQKCIENGREFNIALAIKCMTLTQGLRYALATGNWGDQSKAMSVRAGVAQVLNRYNYLSMLSHLRRINTPIEKEGKLSKPRQLHSSHWGMVCPAETPEGHSCGLVKSISLMGFISVGVPSGPIKELLEESGVQGLDTLRSRDGAKVFVNGEWIGNYEKPVQLVDFLRELRRQAQIESEVSIVYNAHSNEVRICTDSGRIHRPLFVVKDNELVVKKEDISKGWDYLVTNGMIEFLDVEEEEVSLIAMEISDLDRGIEFTHCEIDSSTMMGSIGSIIPFSTHNPSPRNTYQCAMSKQAMGIYSTNYLQRMDTLANILFYPQKPLVVTKTMEILKYKQLPTGQNAIVAIACYSGYNQEDSIIMNQSAIDRGLFRSFLFRTYADQENLSRPGDREMFCKPVHGEVKKMRSYNYGKLNEDGLVKPGTSINGDDVIIGKVMPILNEDGDESSKCYQDVSTPMKRSEIGVVDTVVVTEKDGNKFVKLRVRSMRTPQTGDKFASRHAQKGTIGMIFRQEDMPFSSSGIVPDIIINPHCIPSRMTIGHLIECLSGKKATIIGEEIDGTAFSEPTVESISKTLEENGYHFRGLEVMHCGLTGRKLEAQMYVGPTYYQRLRHMVDDKIHARARGALQIMTRQPVEGRSRDGGLRFGEMERDCIISHGASSFLKERLMDVSDSHTYYVCGGCGLLAIVGENVFTCRGCKRNTDIYMVKIPYAFKLLIQELMAMNIAPRLRLEE